MKRRSSAAVKVTSASLKSPVYPAASAIPAVPEGHKATDGGARQVYDPSNGYRDAYRRIWKPR